MQTLIPVASLHPPHQRRAVGVPDNTTRAILPPCPPVSLLFPHSSLKRQSTNGPRISSALVSLLFVLGIGVSDHEIKMKKDAHTFGISPLDYTLVTHMPDTPLDGDILSLVCHHRCSCCVLARPLDRFRVCEVGSGMDAPPKTLDDVREEGPEREVSKTCGRENEM